MKKIIIQGLLIIALFLGIWSLLSRIDWMTILRVEHHTMQTEEKLGELFWEIFRKTETELTETFTTQAIDSLVNHICERNGLNREHLKVHVLVNPEVNAFALPNGHLVVYTGLINSVESQEELSGVLCHEIAHIELDHVMKKLIKEIGLSALISMTTGNSGGDLIGQSAKMLSSTAFDRDLEREADLKAVDYLTESGINPEPFANFFYNLSASEGAEMKYLSWISTHPGSLKRYEYIMAYIGTKQGDYAPVLSETTWKEMREPNGSQP
jgi:beta-barrel assembly-enhancing protease